MAEGIKLPRSCRTNARRTSRKVTPDPGELRSCQHKKRRVAPKCANSCPRSQVSAQTRPKFGRVWAEFRGRLRPSHTKVGPQNCRCWRHIFGQLRPSSANTWPHSAEYSRARGWPKDQNMADVFAEVGLDFANICQVWWNLGRIWSNLAKHCPCMAQIGQACPNSGQTSAPKQTLKQL